MRTFLAILAVFCVLMGLAAADECRVTRHRQNQRHHAQQQRHGHQQHGHDYHDQHADDFGYRSGAALYADALAERVADKAVAKINARLKAIEAAANQRQRLTGRGTFEIEAEIESELEADVDVDLPADDVEASGPYAVVAPIVARSCVKCHGPTAKDIPDLTVSAVAEAYADDMAVRAFSDDPEVRMPPAGGLSDADVQAFQDYAAAVKAAAKARPTAGRSVGPASGKPKAKGQP